MRRSAPLVVLVLAAVLSLAACAPKFKLFSDATDPLREYVLEGEDGANKIALLPVRGIISDEPSQGVLSSKPSMVQEIVSQLKLVERDKAVKAVVLQIDSPGGGTTASDILYHEITAFKERTKIKVVAAMLDLAASGGYYVALPADRIVAHPTTVTGSVGAIFFQPKVHGLLDKIGVDVEVSKSGPDKDMGSPFRPSTPEERARLQKLIQVMGDRFLSLVVENRHLTPEVAAQVGRAAVYTAPEALQLGLVDEIGYLPQALDAAKKLAGLPADAEVVAYRRTEYPDDTIYNTQTQAEPVRASLVSIQGPWSLPPKAGFYYLWLP